MYVYKTKKEGIYLCVQEELNVHFIFILTQKMLLRNIKSKFPIDNAS